MPQSHMNTSQANGECPFGVGYGTNMARKVCGYSWWSHPDGVSDFQHASPPHLTEVTPGGIASAAVTLCFGADRLLIITIRDLPFFPVSNLQDNFGTL